VTIVVPCYDAEDTLPALVETVAESVLAGSCQLVLVDDGSSDATADVIREVERRHDFVEGLLQPGNAGAGVARNAGFERARGAYILFFDADDVLHVEALESALDEMELERADLALLPYLYDRGDGGGYTAMNHYDTEVWGRVIGKRRKVAGELTGMPQLLGMSNYPWNKVLRTSVYREAGLRFGATPVHNDILGHWHSFLHAGRILLLNTVICTHRISPNGQHLTTRRSRDRLTLFDALDETYTLLEAHPAFRARYAHHYWAFVVRVAQWAEARIAREHRQEFAARVQDHVSRIDLADYFSTSLKRSPTLARQLSKLLMN
jgi:glycosyltransferase involved in cell wall biosynthesis